MRYFTFFLTSDFVNSCILELKWFLMINISNLIEFCRLPPHWFLYLAFFICNLKCYYWIPKHRRNEPKRTFQMVRTDAFKVGYGSQHMSSTVDRCRTGSMCFCAWFSDVAGRAHRITYRNSFIIINILQKDIFHWKFLINTQLGCHKKSLLGC